MWNKKKYKYSLNLQFRKITEKYKIIFGNYGIKSLGCGLIKTKHIENVRRKLSKQLKKLNTKNKSKIYIRFNIWKPYTSKPMLSRMGKGAGAITAWKTLVKKGYVLFELSVIENYKTIKIIVNRSFVSFPLKSLLIRK